MVDYFDLLVRRRSVRDFADKEVPLETIKEIIRDACLAPSSGNGQPWRYTVVNDREWIRRLSDESKKNLLASIEANPESVLKKYEPALRNRDFNVFYNAPCLVYISCARDVRSAHVDCALAACYFMFSASANDLGTCWVDLGADIRDPKIRRDIGLTDELKIIAPIVMGYPRSVPAAPIRNEPKILKIIS